MSKAASVSNMAAKKGFEYCHENNHQLKSIHIHLAH